MPFKNTPQQLRENNCTPLDLKSLELYSSLVSADLISLQKQRSERTLESFNPKYFIMAGCMISQPLPRNTQSSLEDILSVRPESAKELNAKLKKIKKTAKFSIKLPKKGKHDQHGFSLKGDSRIDEKAEEYGSIDTDPRPYSRVVDTLRTTLLAEKAEDIQRLSEYFRPCAMGGVVRFFNAFSQPDQANNLRRILINARMATGLVAEIQIQHADTSDLYDASQRAYEMERAANYALTRATASTTRKVGLISKSSHKTRLQNNTEAASIQEVAVLQSRREFLSVSGYPVVINHDNWEENRFALVPNPQSGLWETDNRFLRLIDDGRDVEQITPNETQLRALAVNNHHELRQMLG